MAADWALADDESLILADKFYLQKEETADEDILDSLLVLPSSCGESAQILNSTTETFCFQGLSAAGHGRFLQLALKHFGTQ